VRDGAVQTACQQACPAEAVVFGNVLDPKSRVSQLKRQARDYAVLGFLDTRPRITYLAKVRNPNPAMPDYHEYPFSLTEHTGAHFEKNASPFADPAHGKDGGTAKKGAH
jgi:molybdopterin-containing oxidoreductase family iron-sulfur binding subunit